MGEDEIDARVSSHQPGRRLRGGKETGHKKTGLKEMGQMEKGRKEMGVTVMGGKAMEVREMGGKAKGAQDSQEKGGKGDMLMGELPDDTTAGQNATEGIQHKSYFEVVIEGVREESDHVCRDSIVRKTDRQLNKRMMW